VILDEFHATVASLTGSVALVSVSGELDLYTSERLQQAIGEAHSVGADMVFLDLSGVAFIDSTALGVIVQESKRLEGRGLSLVLVTNDPRTLHVLEVTGLDRALRRHATLHDALRAHVPEAENIVPSVA
jgi:anti-sigma B factor antagonist